MFGFDRTVIEVASTSYRDVMSSRAIMQHEIWPRSYEEVKAYLCKPRGLGRLRMLGQLTTIVGERLCFSVDPSRLFIYSQHWSSNATYFIALDIFN